MYGCGLSLERYIFMLNENDLSVLEWNLNRIITLITDYGCLYSPDMSRLKLIQKNINIFKECKEGWDELQKYMLEDWNAAMCSQERIIDCHILSDDIDLKAKYNVELEECFRILDKFFETHWINKRIWYTKQDLLEFGKKYKNREKDWNIVMKELEAADRYCVSPIELIPHDIWSFANMLGVAATDDALVEWFLRDVPAFGYLSPMQILGIAGGDHVLRYFLYDIPV